MNWMTPAFAIVAATLWLLALRVVQLDPRASLNRTLALAMSLGGVWNLGSALTLSAPNPDLFWLFIRIAGTGYFLGNALALLGLLDFAGVKRPWRFLGILPSLGLALVQLFQLWTGHWVIDGYRSTLEGNVSHLAAEPGAVGVNQLWSLVNAVVGFGALVRAWTRSRSRRYRTLAVQIFLLGLACNLFGLFSSVVVWLQWGLPDPTALGAGLISWWYPFLIKRYRHLAEGRPDLTEPLLAHLKGTVLLVNGQGQILRTPEQALQLLGPAASEGRSVFEALAGWPELRAHWDALASDLHAMTDLEGSVGNAQFRLHLIPHRNPFGEWDGAIVRLVPEGPLNETVARFGLSKREKEVAVLIEEGMEPKQIAEALFISVPTVRNHLHSLYAKTGTSGRADLVRTLLSPAQGKIE